jgi:hypothetical protein
MCVALRIIWPNFLRAIWHIGATSCPTDHWAFRRCFDGIFFIRSSGLENSRTQIKARFRSERFRR